MKILRLLTALAIAVPFGGVFAETYEVAYSTTNMTFASGDVVSAATEAVPASLPDVGSTPIFHFDASYPNSWTFNEDGTTVTCIPSLVGNRYLFTEGGRTFADLAGPWDENKDTWTVAEPEYVASDPVLGMPCVDFGAAGSCRVMLFDNEYIDEGCTVTTNLLKGIGTVVAVWNSENGGGQLLGGGVLKNGKSMNTGRLWSRGASGIATSSLIPGSYQYSTFDWSSPVAELRDPYIPKIGDTVNGNQLAWDAFVLGVVRHDGTDTVPWTTGFNGGWEVVSMSPTNNTGNAHGIGFGALFLNGASAITGGMKIGEMIVFPDVLSVFDLAKVENYLQKKWFGRPARGTGGNAYLQGAFTPRSNTKDGSTTTFDVPAGETLKVAKVPFGRGKGAEIVKTGAGTLALGDVRNFPGKVSVRGGTLALGWRALPRALPGKPIFHIDASKASSMSLTNDGVTNWVDSIASDAELTWRGNALCAAKNSRFARPFLREGIFPDVNGAPAPAIDFHPMPSQDGSSGMFSIAKATNTTQVVELSGVTTLAAVYAPRATGGTILGFKTAGYAESGCYFERGQMYNCWAQYTQPILGQSVIARIHPTLAPTNGTVMIDGVVRNPRAGFAHRGFQVVIIQVPGSFVNAIGSSYNATYAGGFMLAELALWNRDLTQEEMEDATAYLSDKWMHKPTPGYGRGSDEPYDVQNLSLEGDVVLSVPSGITARVGALSMSDTASLSKTGSGTLEIVNVTTQVLNNVRIADGSIRYVGLPVTSSLTDCAKDPSLHLDASLTNTVYCATPGSGNITYWWDVHHRNFAQINTAFPSLRTTSNLPPTGLPVVDFGSYRSGKYMYLQDALYGVRSAYVVYCALKNGQAYGGLILGSKEPSTAPWSVSSDCRGDFAFHQDSSGYPNGPIWPSTASTCMNSDAATKMYTNGVAAAASILYPTNTTDYVVYEFHLPAGAHVSGLCEANNFPTPGNYTGGGRYGEILLYERALTDREKVATRNYLMKKWLGTADADLTPLPPDNTEVMPQIELTDLLVEDGDEISVAAETPIVANCLVGEGVFTKSGAGVLSVGDVVGFTGTVNVAEGLFKVTSARPSIEPYLPALDNRLIHVDASHGVITKQFSNDSSLDRVMGWDNLADSGWTVTNKGASAAAHPYVYADATLGGRKVVRFGQSATTGLKFVSPDGVQTNMYGMKSGLFILGAHQGGGFLLGGGEISNKNGVVTAKDCFHRGSSTYGDRYNDYLLYAGACDAARTAEYWINVTNKLFESEKSKPDVYSPMETNFYNNAWNSVAFRFTAVYGVMEAVGGFAYCNAVLDRNGSQRLAEVVLYNKRLSNDELAAGQSYLRIKWGLDKLQRSMTNHVSVALADGAALDLGGTNQYFECVSGSGVVSNGTLEVSKLVADPLDGPLTLDGTFSVCEGMEVEIANFSSVGPGGKIPLLACGVVENRSLLRSAVFTGDMSWAGRCRARLVYEDGILFVKFVPRGMILIVE